VGWLCDQRGALAAHDLGIRVSTVLDLGPTVETISQSARRASHLGDYSGWFLVVVLRKRLKVSSRITPL
jgi:hypothetical protein